MADSLDVCAPAVSRHNRTREHQKWRAMGGFTPHTPQRDLLLIGLRKSLEMQPLLYEPLPVVRRRGR